MRMRHLAAFLLAAGAACVPVTGAAPPPPVTPAPPPGAPARPAPAGALSAAPGKPGGEACLAGSECASGVCEGQGCDPAEPGRCAPRQRGCTRDRHAYCGCDGRTFFASGSCPGRRYQAREACPAT